MHICSGLILNLKHSYWLNYSVTYYCITRVEVCVYAKEEVERERERE